ncbi:MAG: heavy metal-binding domain-containing protein [Chloroflexi bacterium]|nr:MAG: heavy metal-binding domain-containing protein [Chloroflexota bacterium]
MRGDAKHHSLFTSDLSVNEFLLVREAGFDPVGLVVGSSIYHIGYQRANWNQNQEMNVLTQAMYHARELAMTRMEEEANALGADGIVGVRLEVTRHEWGEALAEFVAIGTASYRPVGMVMGNCVYHVAHQGMGQWFKQVGQNVEMTNYTQALYDARELAMERMQAEAISLGAQGVVGTQISERSHGWGSHVIEFFAVGTAVISISDTHEIPTPALTLLLND